MAFGIGGSFGGGFASGLMAGAKVGQAFSGAMDTYNTNQERKAQIEAAKKDYDGAVSEDVMQQAGQQAASEQPGLEKPFDAAAANEKAKKKVGSFTDFLYNQKMPQIVDALVAKGDLAGAETMRKWGEDGKERAFMTNFGKTLGEWNAGKASGDYSGFAESAVSLLNKGNYGMTATGYDLVKDNEGNTTGLTFKLKNEDGKEISHTFNSMDEAASFIAAQGSPQNRVKQWQSQQEAAANFKAKIATKQAEAQIGIAKDNAVEDNKQKNREKMQGIKADDDLRLEANKNKGSANKEQQKDEYAINLLRERGFGDDEVNQYVAQKYLGGFRKGKSPQEFAQQLVLELSKDPMNSGKSRDDILKQAQSLVDIANQLGNANKGSGGAPAAAPKTNLPVFR